KTSSTLMPSSPSTTTEHPTSTIRVSRSALGRPATVDLASTEPSTKLTSSPSPRPSSNTADKPASTGHCISAATPTPFRSLPGEPRSKSSPPLAWKPTSTHATDSRPPLPYPWPFCVPTEPADRKSTRLNSSHVSISYAVFCLQK